MGAGSQISALSHWTIFPGQVLHFLFYDLFMYTGLYVQVSGQKRASDHLKLELQIICLVFKKDLIIFILNVFLLLLKFFRVPV